MPFMYLFNIVVYTEYANQVLIHINHVGERLFQYFLIKTKT